jgi:hypothetical protein
VVDTVATCSAGSALHTRFKDSDFPEALKGSAKIYIKWTQITSFHMFSSSLLTFQ